MKLVGAYSFGTIALSPLEIVKYAVLWAIGFFVIDFVREFIRPRLRAEGLADADVVFWEDIWASLTSVMLNVGAFFGITAFSRKALSHPV